MIKYLETQCRKSTNQIEEDKEKFETEKKKIAELY